MRDRLVRLVGVLVALGVVLGATAALAEELPPGGSFTDDDINVHEASIEALASEGVTKGCNPPGDFLYCPQRSVTRAEVAAFLVRALDLTYPDTPFVDQFADDNGSVFENDINLLSTNGIAKGCDREAELFCPSDIVTRGQLAAFLTRAFDVPPSDIDAFPDDDGSVFEADINALAAAGFTKGCNDGLYCPEAPVGRDQMASFLSRALGLAVAEVPSPIWVPVIQIIDGDTILVEVSFFEEDIVGREHRQLQLVGIEAPGAGEECAIEATEAMKALVEGARVRIDVDVSDEDQDGRLLRNVFSIEDGSFINERLVAMGWARVVASPPDITYSEVLSLAEEEAQDAGRGIWGSGC